MELEEHHNSINRQYRDSNRVEGDTDEKEYYKH